MDFTKTILEGIKYWVDNKFFKIEKELANKQPAGDYALKSDIPEINYPVTSVNDQTGDVVIDTPETLPNPNSLIINNKEYDGSEAISIDTTIYEFNVTVNEDGTKVLDKTYDDILAAHESGRTVICDLNMDVDSFRLPLVMAADGLLGFVVALNPATCFGCVLTADGAVEIMDSQSMITINGQVWDGDDPINFTDTINNMIDEKVPTKISDLKNDLISGATVGQIVQIVAVDENGIPTAWEAVDPWIITSATEGSTKQFKLTIDDDGILTATEIVESEV